MSKSSNKRTHRGLVRHESADVAVNQDFDVVVRLIDSAPVKAVSTVNTTLIDLYWNIGQYISQKIESADWGEGVVEQLAAYIARRHPGLRGFTRSNLLRMRQFHDTCRGDAIVAAVLRQLPWTTTC